MRLHASHIRFNNIVAKYPYFIIICISKSRKIMSPKLQTDTSVSIKYIWFARGDSGNYYHFIVHHFLRSVFEEDMRASR